MCYWLNINFLCEGCGTHLETVTRPMQCQFAAEGGTGCVWDTEDDDLYDAETCIYCQHIDFERPFHMPEGINSSGVQTRQGERVQRGEVGGLVRPGRPASGNATSGVVVTADLSYTQIIEVGEGEEQQTLTIAGTVSVYSTVTQDVAEGEIEEEEEEENGEGAEESDIYVTTATY